ncbi:PREDICTED: uncharacterized protein LOC109116086 [Tarenaya hassleriana]|uniref:uncharacterized protein LOC109116086 n=1 Tax=Tarenaya hassleriana TaxID=28532 RepID=UPI0008FD4822|nr:PREDICTED: uncharacterized protein LOC109116086 [Tarenaya hassleriana]
MLSVVIFAELLGQYTAALAKIVAGLLPHRPDRRTYVRIGSLTLTLPCPNRPSAIPDFTSHLVDL